MVWYKQQGRWKIADQAKPTLPSVWMYIVTHEGRQIVETALSAECNLCRMATSSACICSACQGKLCVSCALTYNWFQGSPKQRCCTDYDLVAILQLLKEILQPLLGCDKRELMSTCRGIKQEYSSGRTICCISGLLSRPFECECGKLHKDVMYLLKASMLLQGFVSEFQRVPLQRSDHRWNYDRGMTDNADAFAELITDTWMLQEGAALYHDCGTFKLQRHHDRYDRWIVISTAFDKLKEQYLSTGYSSKTKTAALTAISYGVAGVTFDLYHMLSVIGKRMWNVRLAAEETRDQSNLFSILTVHDLDNEEYTYV